MDIDALKESLTRREEGPDRRPLWSIPKERVAEMLAAADVIEECTAAVEAGDSNLVAEILRGQGTFTEWDHYPKGDIYDRVTHSQYYYHAHPSNLRTGEHGHFHLFVRQKGMPKSMKPAALPSTVQRPLGKDALAHLVGVSMDPKGLPIRLFTVNRWVTGETWYGAADVTALLDLFEITHAVPSWPTNRWMGAMVRLFQPQIAWLQTERDEAVRLWQMGNPEAEKPVYEDHGLEVTSVLDISVENQIKLVRETAAAAE
jgi:hypothetical protein